MMVVEAMMPDCLCEDGDDFTPKIIMVCNRLLKTGCNNVVGATLFIVVNNIEQYCGA